MTAVSTRLVRLLNMVPYFQANPKITYAEAASDLGVSVKQLRDDLNQLWMCGLPGYGPGDLIDFEFSGDTIEVTFTAGIDHPLRLTSPEATGILVALRTLLDVPGMVDPEAARSAIAKIESAAGTLSHGAEVTPIGPPGAVKRPDGINLREIVDCAVGEWPNTGQARVWVADGRATALRRRATVVGPRTLGGRAGEDIVVDMGMLDRLAREIASYGADAVALEPQQLRDDVLARLRAQAGLTDEVNA